MKHLAGINYQCKAQIISYKLRKSPTKLFMPYFHLLCRAAPLKDASCKLKLLWQGKLLILNLWQRWAYKPDRKKSFARKILGGSFCSLALTFFSVKRKVFHPSAAVFVKLAKISTGATKRKLLKFPDEYNTKWDNWILNVVFLLHALCFIVSAEEVFRFFGKHISAIERRWKLFASLKVQSFMKTYH